MINTNGMCMLSILTARYVMSVALLKGNSLLGEISLDLRVGKYTHETVLFPSIQKMLRYCSAEFSTLSAIAISCGPGAFTSLRVGITAAKALAYANDIPVICVNLMEAYAYKVSFNSSSEICVVMQSRRDEVFTSVYICKGGFLETMREPMIQRPESVVKGLKEGTILCGDAISLYKEVFSENKSLILSTDDVLTARTIGYYALLLADKGKLSDPVSVLPIYLRSAIAF